MGNSLKGHPRIGDGNVEVQSGDMATGAAAANLGAAGVNAALMDPTVIQTVAVTITNAQLKALRATPKTLVAAPGASKFIEFVYATIMLKAGANVLTESTANLGVRYNDGSGTQISETVESTGFIDQATDQITTCRPKQDGIVAAAVYANKPLVLHNLGAGEFAGNAAADATVKVFVAYRVWPTT